MNRRRLLLLVLWAGAAFLTAGPAPAQGHKPFSQDDHAFRFLLYGFHFKPLASVNDLQEEPEHTVLIVCGETDVLGDVPGGLQNFIERGGSVLIATDLRTNPVVEDLFGIRVDGARIRARDPKYQYKGKSEFPLVTDNPYARNDLANHPLFQNVKQVATNWPSFLEPVRNNLEPAFKGYSLQIPYPDWKTTTEGSFNPGPRMFGHVRSAEKSEGRFILLADHSVFINSMMLQPDNDNFQFAFNCVQWLAQGDRRQRVLYFNDGQAVTDLKVPVKDTPEFGQPRLPGHPVDVINQILADVGNNLMVNWEEERLTTNQVVIGLAATVTAVLFGYGLLRLQQARHRTESG